MGYLRAKADAILRGDFTPSFALQTAEKDARLVVAAGEAAGSASTWPRPAAERFRRAAAQGHGEEDMAATWFASFGDGKDAKQA